MKISTTGGSPKNIKADLLAVCLWEGDQKLPPETARLDRILNGSIKSLIDKKLAKGAAGKINLVSTLGKISAPHLAVLGLGKKKDFDLDRMRSAAAKLIGGARGLLAKKVAVVFPEIPPVKGKKHIDQNSAARALAEGAVYANWLGPKYQKKLKQEDKFLVSELSLAGAAALAPALKSGRITAEAVNLARELVETPANQLTPQIFADKAREIARTSGLKFSVLDEKQIKNLQMGAFLSVTQGSHNPPRLVVLEYAGRPAGKEEIVALVGKGITFDSGGISLKPSRKLAEMKTDMSGAAAVLAAIKALAELKAGPRVLAVIPLCENMPSGGASRPGDVVKSMDGTAIEIISTDAEGRMILADALLYAKKLGAQRIIDVATLTGACVIALGDAASGLMGNNKELVEQVEKAAEQAGEKVWELPLYPEYEEYLKSEIADLKNASEDGKAGTSKGGIFLKRFVGKTPWAHLDIAGTAYLDTPRGWRLTGPTGAGVRTIAYLLDTAN